MFFGLLQLLGLHRRRAFKPNVRSADTKWGARKGHGDLRTLRDRQRNLITHGFVVRHTSKRTTRSGGRLHRNAVKATACEGAAWSEPCILRTTGDSVPPKAKAKSPQAGLKLKSPTITQGFRSSSVVRRVLETVGRSTLEASL